MIGCHPSTPSPTESSLAISADRALMLLGESAQLRAIVTYTDGSVVDVSASTLWKSSDETVFSVLPNGVVRAISAGRATITAMWRSFSTSFALAAEDSIRGRVSDFRTEAAVPGVVVRFAGESQDTAGTTDANGVFFISMPGTGRFDVWVDSTPAGDAQVTGSGYRGDLIIDSGTCVSRYGTLADARTLKPVVGASVSVAGGTAPSGPDGWYRIDLGCPSTGTLGYNTTFLYVTHPNYTPRSKLVGRGVRGVARLDLNLDPK
jgi:hypothetical protein